MRKQSGDYADAFAINASRFRPLFFCHCFLPLFKGIINLLILYHTITVALKSIVIVLDGWVADGSVDFFGVDPEIIMWYSFFHLKPSEWRKKK